MDFNEKMEEIIELSIGESNFYDLLTHFQIQDQNSIWERAFLGEEISLVISFQNGEMTETTRKVLIKRVDIENIPHMLLTVESKTPLLNFLKENHKLETMKKEILDGTSEMVIYHDLRMCIQWANKTAERMIGFNLLEMKGEHCYQIWMESETPCIGCPVSGTIKNGEPEENILLLKGKYYHIRSYPYYEKDRVTGVFSFIMDISHRMEMERALVENRLKIKKLHEISFKMDTSQSEEEICRLTVEAAEKILDFHVCTIDLVEGDYFVVKATSSGVESKDSRNLPISEGIGGKCLREGKTFVGNIDEVEEAKPAKESFRSVLSIPIGAIGVFQAISYESDAFSVEDVELADLLISHTREALKRIRTERNLTYLSFHDSLTGLYNRSFFEEELKRLDAPRQFPLSIIVIDVNGLKLVNDNFGHQEGDGFLQDVAHILKRCCRQEDIISRCGGDEFLLLLPKTDLREARRIRERIIEESERKTNCPIPITMAIGVDTKTSSKQDIYTIMKRAEDRMYEDKFQSRSHYHGLILKRFLSKLTYRGAEVNQHFIELQRLGQELGEQLHLSQEEMEDLSNLIKLHDIGLIRLSPNILNKEGQLSMKEWEEIKKHPEYGYRIVRTFDSYLSVADSVLTHHEWWNGMGYPHGLKGEEIPLLSRIFSILDAYVSMTQKDFYRKPLTQEEAITQLRLGAGTQFDPHLLEVFLQMLAEESSWGKW